MNRYLLHEPIQKDKEFYAVPGHQWRLNPEGVALIAKGDSSWPDGVITLIQWVGSDMIECQGPKYRFNLLRRQLFIYFEPVYE